VHAAALEHPLAVSVPVEGLRAVPDVTVALDGKPTVQAFDDKIDAVVGHRVLGDHPVSTVSEMQEYVRLEPAVERPRRGLASLVLVDAAPEIGEADVS
jgi:hypothetical protein